MKEPTYRNAISHAWKVVWRHKILWVFGLFSVFLGQLGFSDIFGRVWSITNNVLDENIFFIYGKIVGEWQWNIWSILGLIWIGIIFAAIGIFLIFLSGTSQGTLISYSIELYKNDKYNNTSKSWRAGVKHFWNILGINVIRKVLLLAIMLAFGFVLKYFFYSNNAAFSLGLAVGLVLLFLISLVISIISIYSLCYTVMDEKNIFQSAKSGWGLFSHHLLVSVEVGFILMLLNAVLIAAVVAGGYLAFLPATLIWVTAGITNTMVLAAAGLVLGVLLWTVFTILVAALFNSFTTSAWSYLFMKMHKEGIHSRIIHLFKHFMS